MADQRCGTCKHYRVDAVWKTAGICDWPMPPWVMDVLHKADLRARIVGQSSGADCPVWQKHSLDIQRQELNAK